MFFKFICYTSQLKCVFRLENMSRAKTHFLGNDLNFRLARDQVVHLWNCGKVVYASLSKEFFAAMAPKRFQTRTEEELAASTRKKLEIYWRILTLVIWINIYDLWLIL